MWMNRVQRWGGMGAMLLVALVAGAAPDLIDYQGNLTDADGTPIDGSRSITFAIYSSSNSASALWSETQSVSVRKGLFHVLLGTQVSLPSDLFDGDARWLGVMVESDEEMTPRARIVSVAYALRAEHASSASTDGDWTVTGGNVVLTEGNVGIGTTDPSAELEVHGLTRLGQSGVLISEIRHLSGKTFAAGSSTTVPLPAGWTEDNTRILSAEAYDKARFVWAQPGYKSDDHFLRVELGGPNIWLHYPGSVDNYKDSRYRIVVMKVALRE